ncbi:unnamed protein product [Amoebophrya sp. A120]|nr:unnamed protein product [Amoebophrya sp. A120]|eukprot:GSA120T00007521001.1
MSTKAVAVRSSESRMLVTTKNKASGGHVMLSALAVLGAAYSAPGLVNGAGLRPAGATSNSEDPPAIRVYLGLGGSVGGTLPRRLDASTAARMLHDMASGLALVPANDKIVYNGLACQTQTVDSLLQGRAEDLGTILPPGTEEINLFAGMPDLLEEMPAEGASLGLPVDGAMDDEGQLEQICEVLQINAEDLLEDRYAARARKKHKLSGTKLEDYLAHLRTQAEEHVKRTLPAIGKEKNPERKLDHQRKLVKLIFAWRNLNGSKGWAGFPDIEETRLIQISAFAIMALFGHARASEHGQSYPFLSPTQLAFSHLCRYYVLVKGEFRDALKSAWVAPLPEFPRADLQASDHPRRIFRHLITNVGGIDMSMAALERSAKRLMENAAPPLSPAADWESLLLLTKQDQARVASYLEDIEALASRVELGGPVRFFDVDGILITATRVGWSEEQEDVDEFAEKFHLDATGFGDQHSEHLLTYDQIQSARAHAVEVEQGKSKFGQFVLEKLKSDLDEKVEIIMRAEKARRCASSTHEPNREATTTSEANTQPAGRTASTTVLSQTKAAVKFRAKRERRRRVRQYASSRRAGPPSTSREAVISPSGSTSEAFL